MTKSTASLSRTFRRFPELVLAGASVAALVTSAGCAPGLPSMNAELTDADVSDILSGSVLESGAQIDEALYIVPTEPMHHGHDHEEDAGADVDADAGTDTEPDQEDGSADVEEPEADQEDGSADAEEPEDKPEDDAGADQGTEEATEGDEPDSDPQSDDGSDDPQSEDVWQVVAYGDAEADFELFGDIQVSMDGAAAMYGWLDMGDGPIALELQGMSRSIDEDANQVSARGTVGKTSIAVENIGISRECGYIEGGSLQISGNGTTVELVFTDECDSCFSVMVDGMDQGKACID